MRDQTFFLLQRDKIGKMLVLFLSMKNRALSLFFFLEKSHLNLKFFNSEAQTDQV